jgi:hypothetical protein
VTVNKFEAWKRKIAEIGFDDENDCIAMLLAKDETVDILADDEQKFEVSFYQLQGPGKRKVEEINAHDLQLVLEKAYEFACYQIEVKKL